MIHGVFGKLGSGKGLFVMDIIVKELIDGFRDVVTNVPVRTVPWVNGQRIPQIGLRAYLLEKLFPLSEDEVDEILKRVRVIEDIDKGSDIFLWRRDGETGEWFKLDVTKTDEKGRPERFDGEQIKQRRCSPVLCVTDEAWQFYPNNGGWARAPLLPFYARQQRKLRDEWYIVTQHPTDCDETFWKIAQDFMVCRNHGMERMGIFRQPSMFRVITYLTNPAKGNAIRSHETYRRLDKKLAQCYDTTAGVGINGGFAGDSNQRRKGFSFVWLAFGIFLLVAFLCAVPFVFRKVAQGAFFHTLSGGRLNKQAKAVVSPSPVKQPVAALSSSECSSVSAVETNQLWCTGFVLIAGKPQVMLSDGTIWTSPDVQRIRPRSVLILGKEYPIRVGRAESDPVQLPDPDTAGWRSLPSPVNQADVTVIGPKRVHDAPRLNGFAAMTGARQ